MSRTAQSSQSTAANGLDWPAVASILGERVALPVALLDSAGRIRVFNRAMARTLGRHRLEVEGRPWADICPPGAAPETERWLGEALRGTIQTLDVTVLGKAGNRVLFRFEFALVGNGPTQGLLMTATSCTLQQSVRTCVPGDDLDYEITGEGPDFGALFQLRANGESVPLANGEVRCHNLLYGLRQPCADCPVLRGSSSRWPRTSVRHRLDPAATNAASTFEIMTARPVDGKHVQLHLRSIPESTLAAIQEAKVEELAAEAKLSRREREVLGYMLLGRNIQEMAQLAGITPRTVKHHQAAALKKLGADSRADLMRIVVF